MKRVLQVLGGVVVLLALTALSRPVSELALFLRLNGQPQRWTLPDGGQSMLIAASGQACADLTGSGASILQVVPFGPMNLCLQPNTGATGLNVWDGGCNTIDTDPNFGLPVPAYGAGKTLALDPSTTAICAASDAGVVRAALFKLY